MEHSTIIDNKNFKSIGENTFIKENFLSEEDYQALLNRCNELSEEEWNTHPTASHEQGKISINLMETMKVSQEIIEMVIPSYWINEHKTVNRMKPEYESIRFGYDDWSSADYIAIYYFGDFEGGNLKVISDSEDQSIISIKSNNLYLLPIANKELYLSEDLLSGVKYSFVDWVYKHSGWAFP